LWQPTVKICDPSLHRFDTVVECDGRQAEGQTHTVRQTLRRQLRCVKHYILSRVKNHVPF